MTQSPQGETQEVRTPQVALHDHPEQHQYTTADGAEAFVQYTRVGGTLVLRHTEVPAHLAGRGVATAVLRAVFEDVRARGLHIKPICPFAVAFARGHPEFTGLLSPQARATLGPH
ncbi:GNAT family N-acetyltransferase [Deinococcus hohokamensis]|uniref:GNAT family N-acetyltransferase n=1 Tax=Deinococcus hohokamensis TaxID=309883 RepID=A0ABV9I6E9_9DEIO